MKKYKKIIYILLLILLLIPLASCAGSNIKEGQNANTPNVTDKADNDNIVDSNGRKIIYKISYRYESKDIKTTIKDIKTHIIEVGGYINSSDSYDEYANYEYKIPTEKVDEIVDYIDTIEGFKNKNINTTDITSTFDSITAKINVLEARKKIYENEINNNTELTTQEKLRYVEQIESIDYELSGYYKKKDELSSATNYSTLTINYKLLDNTTWISNFGNVMISLAKFIGITIAITAPFAVVGIIIFVVLRKKNKKEIEE